MNISLVNFPFNISVHRVVKEASGAGRLVESEFPQGGEVNPSMGRSGCLRRVVEADLNEFERRESFEERD